MINSLKGTRFEHVNVIDLTSGFLNDLVMITIYIFQHEMNFLCLELDGDAMGNNDLSWVKA